MEVQHHRPDEHEEIILEESGSKRVIRRVESPSAVEVETFTEVHHGPWSPGQFISLAIGILFIVLGVLAVVRGGINDIFNPVSLAPFHRTPLMGFIELGFGVLMLAVGSVPSIDRGGMTVLGAISLAWGIIVVATTEKPFLRTLGLRTQDGWLYVIIGAIVLLVAAAAPVILGRDRVFRRVTTSRTESP